MALAAQQQPVAQPYYPAGDSRNGPAVAKIAPPSDPVEALAAGHSIQANQPAAPQSQGSGGLADPSGYASSIIRNAANAATFNLADPAAAAVGAIFPVQGYTSTKPTYGERYDELLKLSRGETAEGQKAHPYVSLASSIGGGMLNPVANAMPIPASLGGAVAQGAALGGAYGAGGAVGNSKDMADALKQTAMAAGTGGAAGGAAYGLGRILSGATRTPEAQLLSDEGVRLTPGQSLGGTVHTLEDATTHIPMLGNAIKGRQSDAIEDFNRAFYNRTLEPLGIQYDPHGPVGNEGIQNVGDAIGHAYDRAYNGAAITNDPALTQSLQTAVTDATHNLAAPRTAQVQANIDRLITTRANANGGQLAGDDLVNAKNWFAEQSRAGPTASLEDRATSQAYGDVLEAIKDGIRRSDPQRGALLDAADNAYARLVPVQQASGLNASSGRGGIFTAAQIGQALRSTDRSTRRGNFARGTRDMQDLAQAGQSVLPSTVPDSGTALRGLLELGAGGAITHEISPEAAMAGAGLIGGGTSLYSRPGQALARALLHGAPASRRAMGAIPPTMLPGFVAALSASGNGGKP